MTDEADKSKEGEERRRERIHPMKHIIACVFGLLLVCCSATLSPPTSLAVLIALSSPTPTLVSKFGPTKKKGTK
jgi:hypothetical protein